MATKYYGINDKWTDDDVENVIEIASEDGSVASVKVNGEDYGGGGGGGVTQATVMFHVTVAEGEQANISYKEIGTSGMSTGALYGAHFDQNRDQYYATNPTTPYVTSLTVEEMFMIIKPTSFAIDVTSGEITAVSGSASWNEGDTRVQNITGNCDIYVSA